MDKSAGQKMKLVLENAKGKTVRTFMVSGETAVVVSRADTRRVEIHANTDRLKADQVKFITLADFTRSSIEATPIQVGVGRLRVVGGVLDVARNEKSQEEDSRSWYSSLLILAAVQAAFLAFVFTRTQDTAKIDQELKQQVVQIVKRIQMKPQTISQANVKQETQTETTHRHVQTTKTASVKRMGALSVFGSLSRGHHRGGINLGAVNSSAGPGLGGKAGSGGMQTTLYGKGLVSASLGAGSNLKGGGGYGTKGKGGGQAGYGKLSLVGSAGTATIPLGREALIEGGLDRDLIADVINRNMGQVRFCYEQGLQANPGLMGRVAIAWIIGGRGQVKTASVDNTTLNSQMVEECIVRRLRSWKFPMPQAGADVKVTFPFMLRRAGQG
jgi:hypothetical protein